MHEHMWRLDWKQECQKHMGKKHTNKPNLKLMLCPYPHNLTKTLSQSLWGGFIPYPDFIYRSWGSQVGFSYHSWYGHSSVAQGPALVPVCFRAICHQGTFLLSPSWELSFCIYLFHHLIAFHFTFQQIFSCIVFVYP